MPQRTQSDETGPFRADQLKDGDRYELHQGHPIYMSPSGREHAGTNLIGGAVLESDPDVDWAGVDAGFSPTPDALHAPDVAIAAPSSERGWIKGVPALALEYAASGQNEQELKEKIANLLDKGTQQVWVVRLVGPRRVEVHRHSQDVQVLTAGELLEAPGVLRNPVPVEALYDRDEAHQVTLRNLLQRKGYNDLDEVRSEGKALAVDEGRALGLAQGVILLMERRGLDVDAQTRDRIQSCRDQPTLERWLLAAAQVGRAEDIFE